MDKNTKENSYSVYKDASKPSTVPTIKSSIKISKTHKNLASFLQPDLSPYEFVHAPPESL